MVSGSNKSQSIVGVCDHATVLAGVRRHDHGNDLLQEIIALLDILRCHGSAATGKLPERIAFSRKITCSTGPTRKTQEAVPVNATAVRMANAQ